MKITNPCMYCGCGCLLEYEITKDGKIKTKGVKEDEMSEGMPCVKGLTIDAKNEMLSPLVREKTNKEFEKVDWGYALEYLKENIESFESEEIGFFASGEITTEDNYALQKYARGILMTNNIDSTARLCHQPTVEAYKQFFGIGGNPYKIKDLDDADLVLTVGTNLSVSYPVVFYRILRKKKKLWSVYYKNLPKSKMVLIEPGKEVLVLIYLIKKVKKKNKLPKALKPLDEIDENWLIGEMGNENTLNELVEELNKAENPVFFHGMHLTQQENSTELVKLLLYLSYISGGKVLTLRGKINIQSCGDVFCYNDVDLNTLLMLEKVWKTKLNKKRGKDIISMVIENPVKFLWVSSSNPALSFPCLDVVRENLKKMFLVVSHYKINDTVSFANIFLPTPYLFERNGHITNGERKIIKITGIPFTKNRKREVEIIEYLTNGKIKKEGLWEEICRLLPHYKNKYAKEDMELHFPKITIDSYFDHLSKKYPFVLTTSREYKNFLTTRVEGKGYIYISEEIGKEKNIKDGDEIIIVTEKGRLKGIAKIDKELYGKTIEVPIHYKELKVNSIIPLSMDKHTRTPNLKVIAANVVKV